MADGLALCSAVYGLAATVEAGSPIAGEFGFTATRYAEMAVAANRENGLSYPNATRRVDTVRQRYLDDLIARHATGGNRAVDPYTAELLGFCGPLEQRFLATLQ